MGICVVWRPSLQKHGENFKTYRKYMTIDNTWLHDIEFLQNLSNGQSINLSISSKILYKIK